MIATAVAAQNTVADHPARDPNALVREVVTNELQAEQNDNSYWRYLQTDKEHGKTTVREVVETKKCDVHRDLSVDGEPLSGAQAAKEKARVDRLLKDPDALSKKHSDEMKEVQKERTLLKMLPDAFRYKFVGQEGKLLKLDFTPNPSFHASSHESEVFHHMSGSLWLDPQQKRIARIQGTLTSDVHFGGFLGWLRKGGTFDVQQRDMGHGYWELSQLDVHMRGRMLFFKGINVEQSQHNASFAQVPADITPEQVAQILDNVKAPSSSDLADNSLGE
jgi:hypothetical protein